mgnify:CR=1 FL=1|jgi:hypothetical protein
MKLKRDHFSGLSRIFGEKDKNLAYVLNTKPDREDFDTIDPIEDTDTATAKDVADKLNEILAALKTPAAPGEDTED